MELKIKLMKWSSGLPVAMLNKKTAEKMGAYTSDRISIKTKSRPSKEISTIINIVKDLIGENQIAVSSELKDWLGLRVGQKVDVSLAPSSKSLTFIKEKLNGKRFTREGINEIIKDIVSNSLSEPEIALFISAMYKQGMNRKETISLINEILETGNKIRLRGKFIADKHSIGGVPGNRTTPIVISICASAGLIMPKTSSRAITTAAGTADVIEAVAKVEYSMEELKKIIKKTNACMVWGGGALGIVPADSKIIRIEKILKIDPQAQLLASIMSKKLAIGSKYILIDIPFGKTAKVSKSEALVLKRKFEYLGRYFNRKLKCVLTDGSQPIGKGIGPVLELMDVIKVLDPKEQGPEDLEKKSLFLSGELLELTGKAKKGQGMRLAREILSSGKAFEKFKEIIKAQNGSLKNIKHARFKKNILSTKSGRVYSIDNHVINTLARITGCPTNKSSGLYLCRKVGEKIKRGQKILTIYSESKSRIKEAADFYKNKKPIKIK